MLTQTQQQFIFKRTLFQRLSGYFAWSIGLSGIAGWSLIYWLKPVLVSPGALLELIKAKEVSHLQLAELAVTGTVATSALFFAIVFIALMLISWSKKERQYLEIIAALKNNEDSG